MDKCPICSGEPGVKVRGFVLADAMSTINGERQSVYGSPEDSFALIAEYWDVHLRSKLSAWSRKDNGEMVVSPDDVAMMMTLFKIARLSNGSNHRDSYVDGCGYLALAADMSCGADDV